MARVYEALEVSEKKTAKRKRGNYLRFDDLPYGVQDQLEKMKSSTVLRRSGAKIKSVLFLSYRSGEGTTTVAATFAESLTRENKYKVLLIDGNTRNPCLHNVFDLNNSLGFSDLFEKDKISEIIMNTDIPNFDIISSGKVCFHPSQSFDHLRFEKLMKDLYQQYDFVIFDSSPIANYYDAMVLASHVDSVIMVVQAQKTHWYDVKKAKQLIDDRKIPVVGAVLNRRKYYIPRFVFERFF